MGKSMKFRAVMSLALALALASVFALSSLAASNARETAPIETSAGRLDNMPGAPAGKLMGTGRFTIDGEEAQPGASILSGSTVATGSDGNAVIDLGSLGRIELRPNTTIKVTFANNSVSVSLDRAGSIAQSLPTGVAGQLILQGARLSVVRGEVEVNSAGNARTIHAGEQGTFNGTAEVITTGDAVLVADASSGRNAEGSAPPHGNYVSGGTVGVIAMVGAAAAITVGVIAGGGSNGGGNQLPPRPSQVTP
jgi:ferric-dicitrate binding protein FerR (iron transport regulator)